MFPRSSTRCLPLTLLASLSCLVVIWGIASNRSSGLKLCRGVMDLPYCSTPDTSLQLYPFRYPLRVRRNRIRSNRLQLQPPTISTRADSDPTHVGGLGADEGRGLGTMGEAAYRQHWEENHGLGCWWRALLHVGS
ncbi:hypothetical protein BKA70DRAFT_1300243 [Coprinopsis sp. MPI-PUGE-AT-0042]|nr:hypothetical protein BKA70DRAFT_1300243 [Coprinopsis sp. MPI-PUGE-AT-0042]